MRNRNAAFWVKDRSDGLHAGVPENQVMLTLL